MIEIKYQFKLGTAYFNVYKNVVGYSVSIFGMLPVPFDVDSFNAICLIEVVVRIINDFNTSPPSQLYMYDKTTSEWLKV